MASKTLARSGSSLINRLLFISNPLKQQQTNANLLPQISSTNSLLQKLRIDRTPLPIHKAAVGGGDDAETLKAIASTGGEISFPCGLPSLRFLIDDQGDDALPSDPLLLLPKRTYQPSHIKRKRTHGYLARKATKGGRKVIKRRIAKGRARIAV